MPTKTELLKLLTDHTGEFVSGQQAGEYLGVSRNAVWKAVSKLKEEGYLIESRPNAGYRLTESDILRLESVLARVHRDCAVEVYDTVGSTNDVVKERPLSRKPLVVIANRQTGGRGRYGRRFESPAGTGLYITFGLTPDFAIDRALYVTMASAVATARAIQTVCGAETGIKWVNDLYYHDRKVCGILTEGQTNFETGRIDRLICGIGVNCFPGSFPEELRHKAGSLSEEKGSFSRNALAAEMINEFLDILDHLHSREFFQEYRRRCFMLDRDIRVHPTYGDRGILAHAIDIAEDGGLIVRYLEGPEKGEIRTIHTGEVSVSVI